MTVINASNYSPPNVNYWGDRCCKAEAEIERLREMLRGVIEGIVQAREPHWSADQKQAFLNGIADAARTALKQ